MTTSAAPPLASARAPLLLGCLICLATLALYTRSLLFPMLIWDDFAILGQSWTWAITLDNLWVPHNEHTMPLGRLLTFGLIQFAGRPTALPLAGVLVGPVSLLVGVALLYRFVRWELGSPLYALVAATLFGVTSVYQEAVYQFAASFWVLGMDGILLALLAAQRWQQTGRGLWLDLSAAACFLAPGWYAGALLAGPLCWLYLLPPQRRDAPGGRFGRVALTPMLGTLLFLAISLPSTAGVIMHLPHYGGRTAVEAFHPLVGLEFTARSVVDNLLIGTLGFYTMDHPLPESVAFAALAAAAAVVAWWACQAPDRRLIVLGLGLIGSGYWLIYSARATWGYEGMMTGPTMSRYHLLPQLGLALVVAGGLPGRAGRWFRLDLTGRLTRPQVRALLVLIAVCFAIQAPRGLICVYAYDPGQARAFQAIEDVDAVCRRERLDAATARGVLKPLSIPGYTPLANGWLYLRGSNDPRPVDADEARRLLGVED
jgi:hypothetical protein